MDIVKRLRSHWGGERIADVSIDVADAADEIERLRLANSDLQMYYDYARAECDKLNLKIVSEYERGFNNGEEVGYKRGYDDGSWTT